MTPEQALQILSEATSQLKCTRKEHEIIVSALKVLQNLTETQNTEKNGN
jgi:hypothetical protein